MYRRQVLTAAAGGFVCGLAGCLGGCQRWTDLTFEPVDTEAVADSETNDIHGRSELVTNLARETLTGDEPTIETLGRSPLGWLQYVEWEDAYYEIHEEVISTGTVTGPEYEFSKDRDDQPEANEDPLVFEELPSVDQWRLNESADFSLDHLESMSFSTTVVAGYLEDTDPDSESVLTDGVDQSVLSVDGTLATLRQLEDASATAERLAYSAERIADDSEAFAEKILADSGAELPEVSDDVEWLLASVQDDEDNRLSICRTDIDDSEDEDRIERQREAVDELEAMLTELESDPETPDNISYVYYEDQWYRLSIGETVV